jgi:hypothetical protein
VYSTCCVLYACIAFLYSCYPMFMRL